MWMPVWWVALKDDETGIVTNDDRCVGCWMCVMVCPYGGIKRDVVKQMAIKCDQCKDIGDQYVSKSALLAPLSMKNGRCPGEPFLLDRLWPEWRKSEELSL